MKGCDIIGFGAISPLGAGSAAFDPGQRGEPAPTCVAEDAELASARLTKPHAARARLASLPPGHDRAKALLERATGELVAQLDERFPVWRGRRLGVCVGTSGGGMPSLVEAVRVLDEGELLAPELARAAPYFGPLSALTETLPAAGASWVQVLGACASSTYALGLGLRWLDLDAADIVIAGGYDALSTFIAAGFECLGATSREPMPFRARRDGLALGEGAALLALVRAGESKGPVFGHVLGFGASSDAVHVTAPDRAGAGLVRAARAALRDAEISPSSIGLVSAHGTGTSYNDAAESRAIQAVLAESAARAIVQPYKGVIGHTLGAAGALETLAASAALGLGLAPAAHGSGEVEPSLTARLLDRAESSDATHALKLSSAFGGANAALVVSARPAGESSRARLAREVRVLAVGEPVVTVPNPSELTGRVATDAVKLARMDPVSLLCVCACVGLRDAISAPAETGVIVGTSAATLEIDAEFERRRKTRGAEPRRFPGTSPNLAPGECSIAFGLLGPAFAVGADRAAGLEALLVAHDLVAGGDAEAFLVVAVDHVADFVREVWRSAGWAPPTPGALAVLIGMGGEGPALERGDLASALTLARAAGGAWAGAGPGWPALLRMFEAK